jgi:hypothetical protein
VVAFIESGTVPGKRAFPSKAWKGDPIMLLSPGCEAESAAVDRPAGNVGGAAVDGRTLVRGFGLLVILAALVGYAAGALQLPERESGEITVNTNPPGATIFVDGMHRGSTPLRVSGLRPGTHQLKAVMPGYKGVVLQLEVLPSRKDSLDWMLEPDLPETFHQRLALWPAETLKRSHPGARAGRV